MAPRKCCIKSCRNTTLRPGLHFYGLPKHQDIKIEWCQWIASQNNECDWKSLVSKPLWVCSDHFNDKDKGMKKLKYGAVPCVANVTNAPCSTETNTHASCSSEVKYSSINNVTNAPCSTMKKLKYGAVPCVANVTNAPYSTETNTHASCSSEVKYSSIINVTNAPCSTKSNTYASASCSAEVKYSSIIEIAFPSSEGSSLPVAEYGVYSSVVEVNMNSAHEDISSNSSEELLIDSNIKIVEEDNVGLKFLFESNVDRSSQVFIDSNTEDTEEDNLGLCTLFESNVDGSSADDQECVNGAENDIIASFNQVKDDLIGVEVDHVFGADVQMFVGNPQNVSKKTKKCCVPACTGTLNILHSFPSTISNNQVNVENVLRCKTWLKNIGNLDLAKNISAINPHKKFFLCTSHFNDDQFYNSSRRKLRPDAVPTQFNCPPLEDIHVENLFQFTTPDAVHVDLEGVNADSSDGPKWDKWQMRFEETMFSYEWKTCNSCNESFMANKKSRVKCIHGKQSCLDYTDLNNMDPGPVPPELSDLSFIEEQLIARISPIVTVFKLKGHQLGYSGNVINFPQDITSIAKHLPHRVQDLASVITVRTTNELKPVDFQIRASNVRNALKWLITNNKYYYDVELSEENIAALPEDGNVYNEVRNFQVTLKGSEEDSSCTINSDNIDEDSEYGSDKEDDNDAGNIFSVTETSIPMIGNPPEISQIENVLEWPTIGKEAINEFQTEGYIVQAFPCLFPHGKCDLRAPREKKVTPLNYFKHLMRYHDKRFAQHPRFRFFAMNSLMRWSAINDGNIFIKRHPEYKDMKVSDLKEEIKSDPNLLKKIMFQSSNIRGTRAYWYARGRELLSMVEQIGLPTFFFTLSAADFHWPDLFKILVPHEDFNNISDSKRRKLIADNPQIVDEFFYERALVFITEVLKEKYEVVDYWFRVEYQHRGSPHIHGLLYIKNAPNVLDIDTEEKKKKIIDFYDNLISTVHPNINEAPAPIHPCRVKMSDVQDEKKDLAQLLNKVQRHTKHSEGYCLRKNKKSGKVECRFKFPKDLEESSRLNVSDKNDIEFISARNDPILNNYNAYIIQTWRANMDISPVLSKQALVNYLAKYISKPEKESKQMMDLLKTILESSDDDKKVKNIIQRLYIQCCSERDYSAQETCHLVNGLKLCSSGGRKFVTINFKTNQDWVMICPDERRQAKSTIQKYIERPTEYEDKCLWFMAQKYNLLNFKREKKDVIVQVYPKMKLLSNSSDDNENYYKQEVLLYVPWRSEESLLENHSTWKEVYTANEDAIESVRFQSLLFNDVTPNEDAYENPPDDEDFTTEEWMTISAMGPSQNVTEVELGMREIDINYDWHHANSKYDKYGGLEALSSFIPVQKAEYNTSALLPPFPNVTFNAQQQKILDLVDLQIEYIKNTATQSNFQVPKRIIVQGKAGTGKSLVIQAVTHKIHAAFGDKSYVIMTPTGVSAKAINGTTYHNKLRINCKSKEFTDLKGPAAFHLKEEFENVRFVIIDEFSMVGCQAIHMIDERLKQAKGNLTNDFGDCFVLIFGDVRQLPPVGDSAVYSNNQTSTERIKGKLIYSNFQAAVILSKVMRQSDNVFSSILDNIGMGKVSVEDYNILKQRFTTSVSKEERESFKDAVHLYSTRLEVLAHNKAKLQNLRSNNNQLVPVAKIPAIHNCVAARMGSIEDAEGLFPVLYLAENARVMLKINLWTERGLVNGAMGTIIHILYHENANPPEDSPAILIIKFDKYEGPFINDEEMIVPIAPSTKTWTSKAGQICTRVQFPVSLCYACSTHKSQSLTLHKAYVNIGSKEMATGITYVGLSRVKSLEGLLLEPFPLKRLIDIQHRSAIELRNQWIDELHELHIN